MSGKYPISPVDTESTSFSGSATKGSITIISPPANLAWIAKLSSGRHSANRLAMPGCLHVQQFAHRSFLADRQHEALPHLADLLCAPAGRIRRAAIVPTMDATLTGVPGVPARGGPSG